MICNTHISRAIYVAMSGDARLSKRYQINEKRRKKEKEEKIKKVLERKKEKRVCSRFSPSLLLSSIKLMSGISTVMFVSIFRSKVYEKRRPPLQLKLKSCSDISTLNCRPGQTSKLPASRRTRSHRTMPTKLKSLWPSRTSWRRSRASGPRSEVNSELNFSPNFEGLVLGCIDADFCK